MRTATRTRIMLLTALVTLAAVSAVPAADAPAAPRKPTRFYLVGAGPGDPDLITLRALKVLEQADVVFCMEKIAAKFAPQLRGKQVIHGYWRLFPYYGQDPATLEGKARQECERLAQKRNEFIGIVRKAIREGKRVVVLDGGDPLIYGPWAWCLEEFEDLRPVVVPGVSCFNAANAALRRDVTTSENTKAVILSSTDWPGKTDTIDKLAVHGSTMALFTMKADFREFIDKLSVNYPPNTPVAVVVHAGYAGKERVIRGTLGTIQNRVRGEKLPFEYMIYVGEFLSHRYNKDR